jgi:hypothetical protein
MKSGIENARFKRALWRLLRGKKLSAKRIGL